MDISRAQFDEVIAHAQADAPNECCGFMSIEDGRVRDVHRAENIKHSPYGYEFGFEDLVRANDLEDEGFAVAAYHSHPRSPAEPSQTDINLAHYPNWLYVIVSLAGEPEMRAWRIVEKRVEEEPITVN